MEAAGGGHGLSAAVGSSDTHLPGQLGTPQSPGGRAAALTDPVLPG
ncbi:hypothetical protein ACFV6F_27790 [Kitasatospora phosalacinea]